MPKPYAYEPATGSDEEYRVDPDTGCWEWLGAKLNGYGVMGNGKRAHREYCRQGNGDFPEEWHVHHICENPGCVNPAHLEAMSFQDHLLHHKAKLTLDQIREIRELGRQRIPAVEVAERYGVCYATVYYYWRGERWKGLCDDEWVRPDPYPCRREDCSNLITHGPRHKQFCTAKCREVYNKRKSNERKRARRLAEAAALQQEEGPDADH